MSYLRLQPLRLRQCGPTAITVLKMPEEELFLPAGASLQDAQAQSFLGFSWDELIAIATMGFEGGFVAPEAKQELLRRFWGAADGMEITS